MSQLDLQNPAHSAATKVARILGGTDDPAAKRLADKILLGDFLWMPRSIPQFQAFLSPATYLFYGGQAGGGKTDLLIGLAIEEHRHSIIFRREFVQLQGARGIVSRSKELLEGLADYNAKERVWRNIPGSRSLEFGSCKYEADVGRYKGRPHDLKGFDEVTEFSDAQFRFLSAWLRTTIQGQRTRVVATGNPPTTPEGEWVVEYWQPWLDQQYPYPAEEGEIRWFAMLDDKEREVESSQEILHNGETIFPTSRTFIRASVDDNPFLGQEYVQILQGLPEPLRSQLLKGDFTRDIEEVPWQVIPTAWIKAAQARWEEMEKPQTKMHGMGVDCVRGGKDEMTVAMRFANWISPVHAYPGASIKTGPQGAAVIVQHLPQNYLPYVNLDVIGIGASVYDSVIQIVSDPEKIIPVNFSEGSSATDETGLFAMANARAAAWWNLRELLNPETKNPLALPPGRRVLSDLAAARYDVVRGGIKIEPKERIKKRIGRSPDYGDAIALACYVDESLKFQWARPKGTE